MTLQEILATYVSPVDAQLALAQEAFIEQHLDEQVIDLSDLDQALAYLKKNHFLTQENLTLLMTNDVTIKQLCDMHTHLFKNQYLSTAQYHHILNLIFNRPAAATSYTKLLLDLIDRNLMSPDHVQLIFDLESYPAAFTVCTNNINMIKTDEFIPLLYLMLDLYRLATFRDTAATQQQQTAAEVKNLDILLNFLNRHNILTLPFLEAAYPHAQTFAPHIFSFSCTSHGANALHLLLRHPQHTQTIVEIFTTVDTFKISTFSDATWDTLIKIAAEHNTPTAVVNAFITISAEFPGRDLTRDFIPLKTIIHYLKHIQLLLHGFKILEPIMHATLQQVLFTEPRNILFIVALFDTLPKSAQGQALPVLMFALLEDPQAYPVTTLLNDAEIASLEQRSFEISDFLLATIYNGNCPGYESRKDLTKASHYYKRFPDDSIWYIVAQKNLYQTLSRLLKETPAVQTEAISAIESEMKQMTENLEKKYCQPPVQNTLLHRASHIRRVQFDLDPAPPTPSVTVTSLSSSSTSAPVAAPEKKSILKIPKN